MTADEWVEADIVVDDRGDFAICSNKQNIDIAVVRRLNTPLGDLFYDPTYGNKLDDRRSEAITQEWLDEAVSEIEECLSYELRISVEEVAYQVFLEQRLVKFLISYSYVDFEGAATIAWDVNELDGI